MTPELPPTRRPFRHVDIILGSVALILGLAAGALLIFVAVTS